MAKLENYRQWIQKLLMKYATDESAEEGIEVQLIFDAIHDHYQILEIGWSGYDRIHNCVMHLDIRDGKVWIQRNMTDIQIAAELIEMGVSRDDIVLGLQAPYKRQYTQYGVA